MNIAEIQKTTEQKMQKSVEALRGDYSKIRTGRAHTGLLDHIQVDYYGSMVPLSQVAQIGLGDSRTITVQPWEKKMVPVVEKAIRDSDLGLNPASSTRARMRRWPSATCVAMPTIRSRNCSRRRRSPRTKTGVPKR
jgi:ribosome recycling factor